MKKRHGKTNEQYAFTRDYVATSSPVNLAASNIKDIFFCHILYLLLSLDIYSLFFLWDNPYSNFRESL